MTTRADVDIGVGSGNTTITADTIFIKAVNTFSKDAFANSNNLRSGSAGLGDAERAEERLDDHVGRRDRHRPGNFHHRGRQQQPRAGSSRSKPSTPARATDSVRIDSVSGFGMGVGPVEAPLRRRRRGQPRRRDDGEQVR
jgi:hypothetical protein